MKRIFFFLLLFVAALLVGCSESTKTYTIAVSQCGSGRWREKVNREMLAAQHLYEQNARVCIACADDDTERQIRQIDSLVASGIDLLVVAPNEAAPVGEAIAKVMRQGIPVICFDRRPEQSDYTAFIGGDNVESGRAVGLYALTLGRQKMLGRKVRILEITGAMATTPARERHQGFAQAMEGHGQEVEYVCREGDWTSDEACRIQNELIGTGGQPDVVFCHNDGMATGAYKAVVERDVEGQMDLLGIDGLPGEGIEYVQFGHQKGSYVYPTHGERVVQLALDILTGKPYERDNLMKGMMVTPDNADLMALNSNELARQGQDLITIHGKLEQYFGLYNTQHKLLVASLVAIVLLLVAVGLALGAFVQMRRTLHQRQAMNEEQTLFYTNPSSRKLRQVFETPKEEMPEPRSQDAIFAETLNEAIRKNMANPTLKMDDLGESVGLSRVQLYRKVKAITGLTPVELLRQMRLQQAYGLLCTTTKTVNEIAYEVGFGTPGYFSKCFKQQFGKYPSEVRAVHSS